MSRLRQDACSIEHSGRSEEKKRPDLADVLLSIHRDFRTCTLTLSLAQWITSTSCSSSLCNQVGGSKYDPSGSLATGRNVQIQYAEGEVDGPIVWDSVQLGGYDIDHQALSTSSATSLSCLTDNALAQSPQLT